MFLAVCRDDFITTKGGSKMMNLAKKIAFVLVAGFFGSIPVTQATTIDFDGFSAGAISSTSTHKFRKTDW